MPNYITKNKIIDSILERSHIDDKDNKIKKIFNKQKKSWLLSFQERLFREHVGELITEKALRSFIDSDKMEDLDAIPIKKESGTSSVIPIDNQSSKSINTPKTTDPKWTEYVLGHFSTDELIDKKPTCDGLRRVFELLIGEIIDSNIKIIKPPSIQDPDTTVEWSIRYICHRTRLYKSISDGFNVNSSNTIEPWYKPAVATASTKAEARALRKGLRLQKILSREEIEQGLDDFSNEDMTDKLATDSHRMAIQLMSRKLNIDVDKLLTRLSFDADIKKLMYNDAQEVIRILNEYGRGLDKGGQELPEDILKDELTGVIN